MELLLRQMTDSRREAHVGRVLWVFFKGLIQRRL
jgi:hypothetical protein